ncbi:MAG: DNA polymerase III subunit delta [Candidatus Aminicenantes bacterium]|nr:DNA polymerase III subunit delta [Candidatus Aminicenantes bacterium]
MALKKNNWARIYLFHGEEPFLAELRIEDIRRSYLPEEQPGSFLRYSLDETNWLEIIEALRTGDLFHRERKLVLLKIPKGMENTLEDEEERLWRDYFTSPRPEILLIIHYAGKLDKNSKLYRLFQLGKSAYGQEEEFKELKGKEIENWIKVQLRKEGKEISEAAVQALLEAIGNDLRGLAKEIEKLCLYSSKAKKIELEDVVVLCSSVRSLKEYELIESLEIGKASRAFQVLAKLLDETSEPEIIIGALTQYFKDLLLAREWLEKGQDERKVFSQLRPWIKESFGSFYRAKKEQFIRAVFALSEDELRQAIIKLHSLDQAFKSGAGERSKRIMFEEFLFWYFERRRKKNSVNFN